MTPPPRRRDELLLEEIEETGEVVLVDSAGDRAAVLNATAAAVWLLCDGTRDAAAIADEIVATLGEKAPAPERVSADVERCLAELRRERLLA
ncbi:MAG: PqqD family protein [Planctomycetales bacterium]|nr:PqqD family protein [Planctomycetales bacterium]